MNRQRRQPDFDTYTVRIPQWADMTSERLDRLIVTLAVVITLLAVPVAGAVGLAVYDTKRALYVQQAESRHNITATVVDGAPKPDLRRNTIRVSVQWYWAGTQNTGTLRESTTAKPGDTVNIWVDENGSMVSAPKSETTALLDALVVAAFTWVVATALAAFAVAGVRALHRRVRDEAWQRDIDRFFGRD